MRSVFSAAVATLALLLPAAAVPLDGFFARERLWTTTQAEFEKLEPARPFRWTSSSRDSARAGETELTMFGLPVAEAVSRFEGEQLKMLTVTFYARGDVGDLPKEKFEAMVRSASDAISAFTKTKFTPRGKDASSAVKAEGLSWQAPMGNFLLEYSFTREVKTRDIPFRAEFIRLEITPPQRTVSLLASAANTSQAKFTGATHIKRDLASGDVMITDVPMVDQGQKGYCAVACTERVMRYYGLQVDANEIAQVANSDAAKGTSADAMFDAIKKLGARLRVRVRPIEQFTVRDWLNLVSDYNRVAKKGNRAPEIPDQGHMIDIAGIYHAAQPDVLREVRTKNKADVGRFQRSVQTSVDQGEPLLWSVMLGVVPERGIPQTAGGHMRLIIGYNTKTQEILYSDSWGAGHELKRMPAADAWTMTTGLTSIQPI
ncbi:C39 family peptidase [Verrucomicrobiota bacterium sgz303538]